MMIWVALITAMIAAIGLVPRTWLGPLSVHIPNSPRIQQNCRLIFFMALIYAASSAKLLPFAILIGVVATAVMGMDAFKRFMSKDPLGIGDLGEKPDPAARARAKAASMAEDLGMDEKEARAVLGIEQGDLDKAMIDKAYKKLMGQLHPDKGGSTYLATKINQARDILNSKSQD